MNEEETKSIIAHQIEVFLDVAEQNIYGLKINGPALMSALMGYCIKHGMSIDQLKDVFLKCCDEYVQMIDQNPQKEEV